MGEQADFIIDQIMNRWDFEQCPPWRRTALVKTCNRCGQNDLRWMNVKGGAWRLHTPESELHICRPYIEQVRDA